MTPYKNEVGKVYLVTGHNNDVDECDPEFSHYLGIHDDSGDYTYVYFF